ncbi:MAG: biotin/lipoyl-binding protein, partial [Duncaniella sp.]|nr:biotin/lipoyl-binding protein [Duncaniella sp.]
NQFISLVKGEYGHTPVPIDPAFREKITGSPIETPYDVSSYRKPENPILENGAKLASNSEEYLLLELLPNVANGFLRKRRSEEAAEQAAVATPVVEETVTVEPITGPTLVAPMGGKVIAVNVKDGQAVKKGDLLLTYEAMKMENDVEAEADAVVKRVLVNVGEVVGTDAPLVEFMD